MGFLLAFPTFPQFSKISIISKFLSDVKESWGGWILKASFMSMGWFSVPKLNDVHPFALFHLQMHLVDGDGISGWLLLLLTSCMFHLAEHPNRRDASHLITRKVDIMLRKNKRHVKPTENYFGCQRH